MQASFSDPVHALEQHVRLRRLAEAIVGDSLADDVVQDAWVAALSLPDSGLKIQNAGAWLGKVTRNLAWKRRISDERRKARELSIGERGEALSAQQWLIRVESGRLVEDALSSLREPYRLTLIWRYYEQQSFVQIAERRGLSESAVRSQVERGLGLLREKLRESEGENWMVLIAPLVGLPKLATPASASVLASKALMGPGLGGVLSVALGLLLFAGALWWSGWIGGPGSAAALEPYTAPVELVGLVDSGSQDADLNHLQDGDRVRTHGPEASIEDRLARGTTDLESVEPDPETGADRVPEEPLLEPTAHWKVVIDGSDEGISGVEIRLSQGGRTWQGRSGRDGLLRTSIPYESVRPGEMEVKQGLSWGLFQVKQNKQPVRAQWKVTAGGGWVGQYCNIMAPKSEGQPALLMIGESEGFRIKLPSDAPTQGLRVAIRRPGANMGRSFDSQRFEPLSVSGGVASFLIANPTYGMNHGNNPGVANLEVFLGVPGQGFFGLSQVPSHCRLTDQPYPVRPIDWSPQHFRVTDAETGQPIGGAFISPRSPEQHYVMMGGGVTAADGTMTIDGLPSSELEVGVFKRGYEHSMLPAVSFESASGTHEFVLTPMSDISELTVRIRCEQCPLPGFVEVRADYEGELWKLVSEVSYPKAMPAGGWIAEVVLKDLQPGTAMIRCQTNLPGSGARGEVSVALPGEAVLIELTGDELLPLELVLPAGIEGAEFWIHRGGQFNIRTMGGIGQMPVGWTVPEETGTPWMVYAPGHVPVAGTARDWVRVPAANGHGEHYEVRPAFARGWGVVINVLGPLGPEFGVDIRSADGAVLLGTTDASGFVLVQSPGRLEQVVVSKGADRSLILNLPNRPFKACRLP